MEKTVTAPQPTSEAVHELKYCWAAFWNCPVPHQQECLIKAMKAYQQEWMARRANAQI